MVSSHGTHASPPGLKGLLYHSHSHGYPWRDEQSGPVSEVLGFFPWLAVSHKHLGKDCVSSTLLDGGPTSFTGAWCLKGGLKKSRDCLRIWFDGMEAEELGRGQLAVGCYKPREFGFILSH